eukprot:661583-Pelagomonas_calceolata.AAC.4
MLPAATERCTNKFPTLRKRQHMPRRKEKENYLSSKTIQVIALLAHLVEKNKGREASLPHLVAAPASILPNWVAEFERCAPDLKVCLTIIVMILPIKWLQQDMVVMAHMQTAKSKQCLGLFLVLAGIRANFHSCPQVVVYHGSPPTRDRIHEQQMSRRSNKSPAPFHVLLTTYDYLMGKTDRPRLTKYVMWHTMQLDFDRGSLKLLERKQYDTLANVCGREKGEYARSGALACCTVPYCGGKIFFSLKVPALTGPAAYRKQCYRIHFGKAGLSSEPCSCKVAQNK